MTDLRRAAEMALEALEWSYGGEPMPSREAEAIKAIRQALAEWTPDDTAYRPDGLSMPVDRGAWSDVPDATKWVDEMRGDEPNTDVVEPVAYVHLEGWLSEILWAEDAFSDTQFDGMVPLYTAPPKPDLLNQKCCECGRSGGFALYCGWCCSKGDKPVGYVDQSDLDREGHDFWVSRQQSKNSVPLFIRKLNDT